jgi:hypothetical protein
LTSTLTPEEKQLLNYQEAVIYSMIADQYDREDPDDF